MGIFFSLAFFFFGGMFRQKQEGNVHGPQFKLLKLHG